MKVKLFIVDAVVRIHEINIHFFIDQYGKYIKRSIEGGNCRSSFCWMMDRVTWYMYNQEDREAYRKEKKAQVNGKYVAFFAASKIANAIGVNMSDKQEFVTGKTIHYLLGIMPGALYGLLRHRIDGLDKGRGPALWSGVFPCYG